MQNGAGWLFSRCAFEATHRARCNEGLSPPSTWSHRLQKDKPFVRQILQPPFEHLDRLQTVASTCALSVADRQLRRGKFRRRRRQNISTFRQHNDHVQEGIPQFPRTNPYGGG